MVLFSYLAIICTSTKTTVTTRHSYFANSHVQGAPLSTAIGNIPDLLLMLDSKHIIVMKGNSFNIMSLLFGHALGGTNYWQ
jgi:hypothetical protein